MKLEALEGRDVPAAFNFGPNPISQAYSFPNGQPVPGWTGDVIQAFVDVNGDGFADTAYLSAYNPDSALQPAARMVVYDGRPGPANAGVVSDTFVLGTAADRFGVGAAEGFDTDGDGTPDALVVTGGPGAGAVATVVGPGGARGVQLGPEDYRAGITALDGFRAADGHQEVAVILRGGVAPVVVAADPRTGRVDASFYAAPGIDTFAPAVSGVYVDGFGPLVGVQGGNVATTTRLYDLSGVEHRPPSGGGV